MDGNGSDTGAAYLILGSATPGPVRLDGTDPRVLRFTTGAAGANLGAAVATEDVNGDDVPDLILGAPGSAPGGLLPAVQGRVWVVFGRPDLPGTVNLDNLGADGYQIKGPALSGGLIPPLFSSGATSTFGGQIGGRRSGDFGVDADVNSDGRDDLVLGAGNATSPSLTSGVAYVLFGKADTGTIDLGASSGDPGSNGFRITGSESILDVITPGQAGTSTALPGDVNGDDLADVLVTEPGVDPSGRSAAGTAYLVYGRPGGGVVDLASLGSAGMAIQGGAGDSVATAASLGDVDSDGTPDLLLGGHGAWVVFGRPANAPVDLAASSDSYRLQAPSGSGFDRAQVTGAGDQDGDSIPDAIVGFPEAAAQQGVSYLAYGKLDRSTLDLGTLRGDQGARLDGTSQSRAGIASAGQDATTDAQEPSTTVRAPMVTGSMGQATTIWRPMLTAAMLRPTKCATGTVAFPYRGDAKAPLPICRVAQHKTVDIPLGGKAVRGTYNPSPRCGAYNTKKGSRCYPTAFGSGNASVDTYALTTPGEVVNVVDSFGTAIAKLSEPYYGCFNVYDAAGVFKSSTDPAAPAGCDPSRQNGAQARLEVQGRGCMAKPADEARNYLAGPISAPNGSGTGTGLRGFIDRSKFPSSLLKASGNDLERAYSGCGLPRKGAKPITGTEVDNQLKTANDFVTRPPSGQPLDLYLNAKTLKLGCQETPTADGCTGFYGNYQGPCFISNVALLTTSTTAVSRTGNPATPVESNRAGVVRAVVPRDSRSFLPYDTFGYRDRNEPTSQGLVARWTFGDANQEADTVNSGLPVGDPNRQQHIYGWTVSRSPLAYRSLYDCRPLPSAPDRDPGSGRSRGRLRRRRPLAALSDRRAGRGTRWWLRGTVQSSGPAAAASKRSRPRRQSDRHERGSPSKTITKLLGHPGQRGRPRAAAKAGSSSGAFVSWARH